MWSRYALEMAYELARALISTEIGAASRQLDAEDSTGSRDESRIAELEAKLVRLAREREDLDPEDAERILSLIERYRRPNPSYESVLSVPIIGNAFSRRQARVVRLFHGKAHVVFGDRSKSNRWLSSSSAILHGVPLEMISSKPGRRLVYDELVRIDYGDLA